MHNVRLTNQFLFSHFLNYLPLRFKTKPNITEIETLADIFCYIFIETEIKVLRCVDVFDRYDPPPPLGAKTHT